MLYHFMLDEPMENTLFPLNSMKSRYPDIYHDGCRKYEGREKLLEYRIPLLDCLWNDVIHLTPINPQIIFDELSSLGEINRKNVEFRYYCVDPDRLNQENLIFWRCVDNPNNPDEFTEEGSEAFRFDKSLLESFSDLPEDTRRYYREELEKGGKPMLLHETVSVLYKGCIPVSNPVKINWK